MELIYCPNCGKRSGFKRALGFGTFFAVLITCGLWLLVIPFYPVRCINCGMTRGAAFWESNPRMAAITTSVILGLVVVLVISGLLSEKSAPQTAQMPANTSPPAAKPIALSEEELKRLKDSRQYDLKLIAAVNAVLTAPSPDDALTAYCRFTVQQMQALVGSGGEWYEDQNIGVCRARVLTGVDRMFSPDQLREYAAKAQRELTETDQKLADAGTVLEPPGTPTSETAATVSALARPRFAMGQDFSVGHVSYVVNNVEVKSDPSLGPVLAVDVTVRDDGSGRGTAPVFRLLDESGGDCGGAMLELASGDFLRQLQPGVANRGYAIFGGLPVSGKYVLLVPGGLTSDKSAIVPLAEQPEAPLPPAALQPPSVRQSDSTSTKLAR